MTDVKRYSGRTYARSSTEPTASQKFDEIFNKAKPTNMKWGNASYSKPRKDEGPENKRAKLETEESSDPFSFEFDTDRSPKKAHVDKRLVQPSRTVVLQPAVRLTASAKDSNKNKSKSALDDEGSNEDFTVKKGNSRTYTKRAGRKIKEEQEVSQMKMDSFLSPERNSKSKVKHSVRFAEDTPTSSSSVEQSDNQDNYEELEDGLYIEKDDGSSIMNIKEESFTMEDENEDIFKRPKRETGQPMYTKDGEEITVKFRSQYLDPEVYSQFTENVSPKDPVGQLSNSKVVHKNVLKHDSGTTLIVVCSPKIGDEIKQSNTQTKYFKDNLKDLVKSKKKTAEEIVGGRVKSGTPDSDPFNIDEDPDFMVENKPQETLQRQESPSPIVVSSDTDLSQTDNASQNNLRRSTRNNPPPAPSPKNVSVENIVKNAAPPRKYHRIFRSRNKNFMEPNSEAESVESTPNTSESADTQVTDTQESSENPLASEEAMAVDSITSQESDAVPVEMVEIKEESLESQGYTEMGSESAQQIEVENLSQESVTTDDMGLDSSQQSNMSESQDVDSDISSSQELSQPQPKKTKSVKQPPAERKIFRARGSKSSTQGAVPKKIFSSPKKAPAVYNVRSWQEMDLDEEMPPPPVIVRPNGKKEGTPPVLDGPPKLQPAPFRKDKQDPKDSPAEMPHLRRAVHWQGQNGAEAYTSLHVKKEHKELYTVVKNVKEAHECQEFGETQEFDDDIEYLLAGIKDIEPMPTRCLSCVGLAQKCILPAFRMHLRAHGTVTSIFGCLQDAASDPSLALCTSALMFMLSRDRLNMDLDRETLNLMLRLLGVDQQEDLAQTLSPTATRTLKRNMDRVHEVYNEFLQQSGGKQDTIETDCISTGNLAMESLLSLTSRRAGEWFKEELRSLGALDHIVDTVCSCVEAIGDNVTVLTNSSLENLKKTDRCLRVLENVTYLNSDNQNYLVAYKGSCLVSSLSRGLQMCQTCLSVYPVTESNSTGKVDKESFGWVIYSCSLAILRVLLNLTHDNDTGCNSIGEQGFVIETVLLCILQSPQYVPIDLRFDLFVLSLGLLINLVEHSDLNREALLSLQTVPMYENPAQDQTMLAYLSLVEVFIQREESARQLEEADEPKTPEASPNKSGEWRESDSGMEWVIDSAKKDKSTTTKKGPSKNGTEDKDLDDEETFTKALHKAGKHMENSIVAAYIALLVGCLIQENQECASNVKNHLPDKNFSGMIYMLKKFLGFMNLTSGSGSAGGKSIERVIEVLEKC